MDSNLLDSRPDARHWPPVVGIEPLLNAAQLESCYSSGISRERSQVITGRPDPKEGLISHESIYKILYIIATLALRFLSTEPRKSKS
jgi:hypothetical protein